MARVCIAFTLLPLVSGFGTVTPHGAEKGAATKEEEAWAKSVDLCSHAAYDALTDESGRLNVDAVCWMWVEQGHNCDTAWNSVCSNDAPLDATPNDPLSRSGCSMCAGGTFPPEQLQGCICPGMTLKVGTVAGYWCDDGEEGVGDSNAGPEHTQWYLNTEADCTSAGFAWKQYTCEDAAHYAAENSDCQGASEFWKTGGTGGGCCI
jgi:hypothetical protein